MPCARESVTRELDGVPLPLFFPYDVELIEEKGDRAKTVRYEFGTECGSGGGKRIYAEGKSRGLYSTSGG